jgi:hypothetical protein
LYYSNELSYLLNVDPAKPSGKGGLNIEEIETIVNECPKVCRKKFDLTFDGEKMHMYPLFSLVSHQAPVSLVEKVFRENPLFVNDERDKYGQTIIHYAVRFNQPPIDTLNYLIHRSPLSLEAWDLQKRSPLHTACANIGNADQVIQFLLKETPFHVLSTPDKGGNLPLHLALNNQKCSLELVKSLVDSHEKLLALKTRTGELPLKLAQKRGFSDDIQGYILSKTPADEITTEYLPLALRTAKSSSALPLIKRLMEENPAILIGKGGELPLEVASKANASKVVMKYLYDTTPKKNIPKHLLRQRPTDNEVKKALKDEAKGGEKTKQSTSGIVDRVAATASKGNQNNKQPRNLFQSAKSETAAQVDLPAPKFWDYFCCKPTIRLE